MLWRGGNLGGCESLLPSLPIPIDRRDSLLIPVFSPPIGFSLRDREIIDKGVAVAANEV